MGHAYYYFAASLPMIHWGGNCPMSVEEFCAQCQRLLSGEDFDLITRVLSGDDPSGSTGNRVADSWVRYNRNFRNELAAFRAQRTNRDPAEFIRGTKENEPQLREIIQQAAKMPNLLEAEKFLDKANWQYLDDLSGGHYYDLETLMVYGLKLKILARHQAYNTPKGRSMFDEIRMPEFPESCIIETGLA